MARRRDLTPDEARLWGRVARTARPLSLSPPEPVTMVALEELCIPTAVPQAKSRPAPVARPPAILAGKLTAQKPNPTPVEDASGARKVRRGKLDIDASIDLHGFRQTEAQAVLASFVARHRREGARCVLVVTGKGRRLDETDDIMVPQVGVIRRRLPEWLNKPDIREHVSGYASAHPKHGGSGAYYILLKNRER